LIALACGVLETVGLALGDRWDGGALLASEFHFVMSFSHVRSHVCWTTDRQTLLWPWGLSLLPLAQCGLAQALSPTLVLSTHVGRHTKIKVKSGVDPVENVGGGGGRATTFICDGFGYR